jgi:hypothetical protein
MLRPKVASRSGKPPGVYDRSLNAKFYAATRWLKFRAMLLARNPMCQRLTFDGKHCHSASVIGHHIISPMDSPELGFEVSNIVMLCRSCHPDTRGTPSWKAGVDYTKTIGLEFSLPEELDEQ